MEQNYQNPDTIHQPQPEPDHTVTLEEAREAYVQKNYILFEESFRRFDETGSFQFTFTWPVFFVGILWFLYRKMYIESLIIFLVVFVIGGALGAVVPGDNAGLMMSFVLAVILTLSARWFYWKAVDRQVEKAWEINQGDSRRALMWLRAKGGVNVWLVAAVLVLFFTFTLALVRATMN